MSNQSSIPSPSNSPTNPRTDFDLVENYFAGLSAELTKLRHMPTNAALEATVDRLENTMDERFDRSEQRQAARFDQLMAQFGRVNARLDEMEMRMAAEHHNCSARNANSFLETSREYLSPLRNGITNEAIPDFPLTPAALEALTWEEKRILMRNLGLPEPPATVRKANQSSHMRSLRSHIGLRGVRGGDRS